ncbi:hypothetical protein CSCA_5085 [Clostridium scatologenes]|uniref:Uncharacterized protein n=1 Tax=Clostridium scatologenes TaxID=1548 RepID=A0A0E3JSB5_CLOSL|nr:hypothetical protein CSCA_5085 [Clostridium scatologenes]
MLQQGFNVATTKALGFRCFIHKKFKEYTLIRNRIYTKS